MLDDGQVEESSADRADRLLRAYVLEQFRDECQHYTAEAERHLAGCDEAKVLEFDSRNGSCGCDTGCDYMTLEATVGCPHQGPVEYEYGEFGETWMLVEALEKMG